MNSLSNTNCNGNVVAGTTTCTCPPRFGVCPVETNLHPLPAPAILACGQGFNPKFGPLFPPEANPTAIRDLASVEIDTTCLCFPNIKIEFSTLINFNVQGNSGTVELQLTRSCNNGIIGCNNVNRVPLTTFTINLPNEGGNNLTTLPFSFVFCIENAPANDCTYFVEVTSVDVGTGQGQNPNGAVEFASTFISALAVGFAKECR